MGTRSTLAGFGVLLVAVFLLSVSSIKVHAAPAPSGGFRSTYRDLLEKAKEGTEGPLARTHYYWDEGFHIDTRHENLKLKIGGKIIPQGGYIGADEELQRAFPDLEGPNANFRKLSVSAVGTIRILASVKEAVKATKRWSPTVKKAAEADEDFVTPDAKYGSLDFKIEIDFANVRDIQDIWIASRNIPPLDFVRFGNMKEPFSLEELASITNTTFMERALPVVAFSPGRDIGIMGQSTPLGRRMTWAAGAFLNTSSFSDLGEGKDQISEANSFNLTARVTGLPWYADEGARLLHLGLSYTHQFRDESASTAGARYRTRPESRLRDDRLVDTGELFTDGQDLVNPEFAVVSGPLSFQGEYFHAFVDAEDDPQFWGYYVYGSYFLTGENRNYDTSNARFSRVRPKYPFRPFKGGWGAWELGLRYSYIDLNDEAIKGGIERNLTAGLNWYLTPHTRFMFNYIRAHVKDRVVPPPVDDGVADIVMGRFQLDY
jgi:phosphate-selective porin OprO/OprP